MIKFKEHIPDFAYNGIEPKSYCVENYNELIEKNKQILNRFEYNSCNRKVVFSTDEDGDVLMLSATNESWWWVLGYVDGIDLTKYLPNYKNVYKGDI